MDYEMEAKLMNSRLIRIESDLKEVLEMVEHCKTMLRDRNTHTAAVLYGEIIERLKDEVHQLNTIKKGVNMKVYISGAITGIPATIVKSRFKSAESELIEKGHCPVNPLNNGLDDTASWLDHMRADIRLLLDCDAIYMMVGWPDSKGAIIEKQLAQNLGLKVILQKP